MNEKNKKELLIKIKVNKKTIKRKENNLKDINNRNNIYFKTQGNNDIITRNSLSNKLSDLYKADLDPKLIFRNYSHRTYNYQANEKKINEKGNIISEMQKNKYLKPLLYSKDIFEKILKCKITDPSFNAFHLKNNERNKSISENSSQKFKEESLCKNKVKKNNLFLLNNLKEFNSNYPFRFTNKNLNGNVKYRNNTNELLNSKTSLNKLKSSDKIYQTCKHFYYQNISYEASNNSFKFNRTKNKYGSYLLKSDKKMNNERIGFFCNILEIFFLNIIKKNFNKLINKLSYKSNLNSNRSCYTSNRTYTSGRRFYNNNSAKNYKNNIFNNDSIINKTSTFSNHFDVFDNSKIYNNKTFIDKDIINNSKDIDNFQKRIDKIKINKVMKNNSFNIKYKSDSIDNSKTFNKKKFTILRKINCERNFPYYNNLLVYKKKNSFSKSSKKKEFKKINKNIINPPFEIRNNINLKNTIESEFDSDGIINNQNLYIFIKCYMIKDINYKIKYLYKYKNKKKIYYDIPLSCDNNINFSLIKQNKNIYKKIKIYKLNKNISNGNKRKYYININSYDKAEDGKLFEHNNSIKINLHKKKTIIKKENKRNNDNINKILINCVKLLTKIITKLYLKRKFNLFKNYLKNI